MTKEQFEEWKAHPVTIEVFKELEELRGALQDYLSSGGTLLGRADATHAETAKTVGNIEGLNQVLNISFQDEGV